jgi:superfamily II DNA or RNA helicase
MIELIEGPTNVLIRGDKAELFDVRERLKFRPPNYFMSPRYQQYVRSLKECPERPKGWDGFTHVLTIRPDKSVNAQTSLVAGRGYVEDVITCAQGLGIDVNARRLISPFAELTDDDIPDDIIVADFKLDEAQRRCVLDWLRRGYGLHKMAVNSGKTCTFAAAIALVMRAYTKSAVLYTVPTERLVTQVTAELRKFLPHLAIGQYGGGKHEKDAQVVVATNAVLGVNLDKLTADGWFKRFVLMAIDEAHHLTGATLQAVAKATPAPFKLGATDGAKEYDSARYHMIKSVLGPVRERVLAHTLITSGRSARPRVHVVSAPAWKGKYNHLNHRVEPDTPAWAYVDESWKKATYLGAALELDELGEAVVDRRGNPVEVVGTHRMLIDGHKQEVPSRWCLLERAHDVGIIRFTARNKLICDWAHHYAVTHDWQTLVVCTRTLHVLILVSLMQKMGMNVRALYSAHTTKQRDAMFDWFRSTKGAVLVSPLVKEGVSINEIYAGVIADYVADHDYANQILGRFMRKKADTTVAHVTWFLEQQHAGMLAGSRKLLRDLRDNEGYEFRGHDDQIPLMLD